MSMGTVALVGNGKIRQDFLLSPKALCATGERTAPTTMLDRKSTRLNSSHLVISYAVFCLKKKTCCIPFTSAVREGICGVGAVALTSTTAGRALTAAQSVSARECSLASEQRTSSGPY